MKCPVRFPSRAQPFRSRVASDVLQDGQVVIPAGAEIDGHVAELSTGHFGGHGSILLQPETITLENGSKFQLRAVVISTPGSNLRVGSEGVITPGSRVKRNSIEYGAVGWRRHDHRRGAGWPCRECLQAAIIGAGVVTTHLLVSHPQAKLESGCGPDAHAHRPGATRARDFTRQLNFSGVTG